MAESPASPQLPQIEQISRERAAQGQLETAIWLWFTEADPVSIHTLAIAAQGVLAALCRDRKEPPSSLSKVVNASPPGFQNWMRNSQNFFKHGGYRGQGDRETVRYVPDLTELALADSAGMFHRLFGCTALMDLFLLWYAITYPAGKVLLETTKIKLLQGVKVEEIAGLSREDFAAIMMPLIRRLHL